MAELFSRNPHNAQIDAPERKSKFVQISAFQFQMDREFKKNLKKIEQSQKRDPRLLEIMKRFEEDPQYSHPHYVKLDGILFKNSIDNQSWKICVPREITDKVIKYIHESTGHAGTKKCISTTDRFFTWPGYQRTIRQYVASCDLCQRVKPLNVSMNAQNSSFIPRTINEMLAIDLYGPLPTSIGGVQYILVTIDTFSKLVNLFTLKKATAQVCVKKLRDHYFVNVGKPKRILSDHGSQFTARQWKQFAEESNVELVFSPIRHPQSNPSERVMRELGRYFRTYCSERHTGW
ncbi:MAG: transposase family protein, partial [Nitrososphaera sp.]|nr:transposase family protein [Nitrososphaera sp.]